MDYDLPGHLSDQASDLIQRLLEENPLNRASIDSIWKHDYMINTSSQILIYNIMDAHSGSVSDWER